MHDPGRWSTRRNFSLWSLSRSSESRRQRHPVASGGSPVRPRGSLEFCGRHRRPSPQVPRHPELRPGLPARWRRPGRSSVASPPVRCSWSAGRCRPPHSLPIGGRWPGSERHCGHRNPSAWVTSGLGFEGSGGVEGWSLSPSPVIRWMTRSTCRGLMCVDRLSQSPRRVDSWRSTDRRRGDP